MCVIECEFEFFILIVWLMELILYSVYGGMYDRGIWVVKGYEEGFIEMDKLFEFVFLYVG